MQSKPYFRYFLFADQEPIFQTSSLWQNPLPLQRQSVSYTGGFFITRGDYFKAATSFLRKNNFKELCTAVSQRQNSAVSLEQLEEIRIYQEKHGEFYHPSRIEVLTGKTKTSFVLNVAVTETGKKAIKQEFAVLQKLNKDFDDSFLPDVYCEGETDLNDDLTAHMFLGEWFNNYHEFHISERFDGKKGIRVWEPEQRDFFLTENQATELYRQASSILTGFYNIETYEQIFPWHHAAGDFVVHLEKDHLNVKLITARRYGAVFDYEDNHAGSILESLLVFFLVLSIRMRLDRRDGTGDIVWAETCSVFGTIQGFLEGLKSKPGLSVFSGPLDDYFMVYLSSYYTEEALYNLSASIFETYLKNAPEIPVIKQHLRQHIQQIGQILGVRP